MAKARFNKYKRKLTPGESWKKLSPEKRTFLMDKLYSVDTIYGEDTAASRIRAETMDPHPYVAIDHDYYSAQPERASKKSKDTDHASRDYGDEVGYAGKMGQMGKDQERVKKAAGGVAKLRLDYPGV